MNNIQKIKTFFQTIFILWFMWISFQTNAEYIVYDNVSDFEKAKWEICEAATDGCNNFFLTDGKVIWGTKMFCQDHKVEWTCTKMKEWMMTTLSLPTTTSIETNSVSENDINLYKYLRKTLKLSYQNRVDLLIKKIEAKAVKMPSTTQEIYYDKWINKIELLISKLLLKYPADIALPKKANNIYQILELLKLEIDIKLKHNLDIN